MSLTKASYLVLVLIIGLLLMVLPQINIIDYVQSTITSKFIVFVFGCLVTLGGFVTMLVLLNRKQYKKAETAYQYAANMIPVRFYPLYLQAKLYQENNDNKKTSGFKKLKYTMFNLKKRKTMT